MDLEKKDTDLLSLLRKQNGTRECYLDSREELFDFRVKVKHLIDEGLVERIEEINPLDPPDTDYYYVLTPDGEKYCSSLQPSNKQG